MKLGVDKKGGKRKMLYLDRKALKIYNKSETTFWVVLPLDLELAMGLIFDQ